MHLARLVKSNDRSRGPGQPDWSVLLQPTTWLADAIQMVFSQQLGFGDLTTYASYNKYEHNLVQVTAIMAVARLVWLLLAILLTFCELRLPVGTAPRPGRCHGLGAVTWPPHLRPCCHPCPCDP